MKVKVDSDEWYPVWYLTDWDDEYATEIEMTDAEVAFVKKADADFNAVQALLAKRVEESHKKEQHQ